ncbi:Hypothetical predicted protein [Podarcis lilfordi]|uniref:Uncharacterized protein n=1 Tax=Podarcis lilfordi TaxID=74358 RepID=A0AA35PPF2_9SAUR|nr:Hypothetical predicted protein [Podarcis lilfordi]
MLRFLTSQLQHLQIRNSHSSIDQFQAEELQALAGHSTWVWQQRNSKLLHSSLIRFCLKLIIRDPQTSHWPPCFIRYRRECGIQLMHT